MIQRSYCSCAVPVGVGALDSGPGPLNGHHPPPPPVQAGGQRPDRSGVHKALHAGEDVRSAVPGGHSLAQHDPGQDRYTTLDARVPVPQPQAPAQALPACQPSAKCMQIADTALEVHPSNPRPQCLCFSGLKQELGGIGRTNSETRGE